MKAKGEIIMKKRLLSLLLVGSTILAFTACGNSTATKEETDASDSGKTVVRVASVTNGYPTSYYDDGSDVKTGYDVEVMRLVEAALSDKYTFEWYDAEQDAIYTGLSTGKYDIALTNAYYTQERAENYILPENAIGASPAGLIVRKEDAEIKTLEDAATAGFKAAPHFAGDGNTYLYQKYNAENPDNPLDFTISDDPNCFTAMIQYIAEGRYDCAIYPSIYYETLVTSDDGTLHEFADKLSFNVYYPVDTYAVIAKGEDELAADVSAELGKLKEDGSLSKLAVQFYGFDPFDTNDAVYGQK